MVSITRCPVLPERVVDSPGVLGAMLVNMGRFRPEHAVVETAAASKSARFFIILGLLLVLVLMLWLSFAVLCLLSGIARY
ncbi:hypothetical protein GCM10022394_09260 [Zobellella aerophila]|uniref:DUF2970 domain-containing protein n=1 Tax=Zobellella aerophila TaxID=870480 RepID=A0ABP6VEB9_9GAMM